MKEANWKANRNADHSERAKTPKYANDWDLGQLGADVELKGAKKAPDNLNNEADKDSASGDGEDNSEISSVNGPIPPIGGRAPDSTAHCCLGNGRDRDGSSWRETL